MPLLYMGPEMKSRDLILTLDFHVDLKLKSNFKFKIERYKHYGQT